jgi:hypothetical protein
MTYDVAVEHVTAVQLSEGSSNVVAACAGVKWPDS